MIPELKPLYDRLRKWFPGSPVEEIPENVAWQWWNRSDYIKMEEEQEQYFRECGWTGCKWIWVPT